MKQAFALAGLLGIFLFFPACKNDKPQSAPDAGAVKGDLCKDGGATFNSARNECVCASEQNWNGIRCERAAAEGTAKLTPATASVAADKTINSDGSHTSAAVSVGATDAGKETAAKGQAAAPWNAKTESSTIPAPAAPPTATANPAGGGIDPELTAACSHAKGARLAEDGYCVCPHNGVLTRDGCTNLPGRITADACARVLHPGTWESGQCRCGDEFVLVPNRGGCVARVKGDVAAWRRSCESQMNSGRWDATQDRCMCPRGRVWFDEACQVQEQLSSRDVCESAYNKGKWSYDRKVCECPNQRVWINQACAVSTAVAAPVLCSSEQSGGGTWHAKLGRCVCPRLGHWDASKHACVDP